MRKALIIVHIADIHFGAFNSNELYDELESQFFEKLRKFPRIDMITINGDIYNHELSLNSNHVFFSFKFFEELYKIAKQKNCEYIRILKGTKSHDHDQLDNIILDKTINIKVIRNVQDEIFFKDYRVLYLPEEYIKDPDEYYKEYFNKEYDLILGHGMIDKMSFHNYNSEIQMEAAPVFDSKKLMAICTGPIIFGHIHDGSYILNKIFYCGSFSRWRHGEEKPKGFLVSIHDLESKNFTVVPCINTLARVFMARKMDKLIAQNSTTSIIDLIDLLMKKNNIYKLKLIANEYNDDQEYMSKLATIQNFYSDNKHIDIIIEANSMIDEENNNNSYMEKYDYLFEDDISIETKISKFIYDTNKYKISPERINLLLTNDITKLINETLSEGETI